MAAEQIELETGLRLCIVDLHLLPLTNPQGLVSFYVTLASSILGFVTMFQLRANAPGLKFRDWLAAIAVLAIRTAMYFRRDQHLAPFIVQAVWLVGTLAALLISARRLGRGPAQ